jgi:transcriptional regulator with XRE-family HTH domain
MANMNKKTRGRTIFPMNEFGEFIKHIRESKNLTLVEVAESAGINHSHLSRIENGERKPPKIATMRKLADAIGISLPTLLEKAGFLESESDESSLIGESQTEYVVDRSNLEKKREKERERRNQRDLKKFIEQSDIMFDGVPMTEEDKQRVLGFMEGMFWEATEMNRRKKKPGDK